MYIDAYMGRLLLITIMISILLMWITGGLIFAPGVDDTGLAIALLVIATILALIVLYICFPKLKQKLGLRRFESAFGKKRRRRR